MGCGGSKAAVVEEVSSPDVTLKKPTSPQPRVSTGRIATPQSLPDGAHLSMDDLTWLHGTNDDGAVLPAPSAQFQVQVLLGRKWVLSDMSHEIVEAMRVGNGKFTVDAHGHTYEIDMTCDPMLQKNTNTNKTRDIRIIEAPADDPLFDEEAGEVGQKKENNPELPADVKFQVQIGPQSKRGRQDQAPLSCLQGNPHAQEVFRNFANTEARLCGNWAVFYHSYSFSSLIYEVNAAVGAVLFRFRSNYATLPRILVKEFQAIPDAATLMDNFNSRYANDKRDHHPEYRAVGISVMCSLVSKGPEACPPLVFIQGYSCKDMSFRGVLEKLLESCYVPKGKVKKLADDIVALSEVHGLDVSQFGGKPCKSGKAGHLLQIFIKRDLVDKLAYAAKPYGPVDETRMPLSRWVASEDSLNFGQARIVAHPKYFLRANSVRMHVASADPTFHANRKVFQEALTKLLGVVLREPKLRERAARGIYGGMLPSWFSSEDQRQYS